MLAKTLTLGTMRLLEVERNQDQWVAFFAAVHGLGIRSLHSSAEYESFPLLASVVASQSFADARLQFRHIIKLAEPSFDDSGFDAGRFEERVRAYCHAFATPVVHDVQWMWRQKLNDDSARISDFRAQFERIADAVEMLKSKGLIERFFCFPYSIEFAQVALGLPMIDGLVVYRNAQEVDYDPLILLSGSLGKPCHIIRPFNAGKVFADRRLSPAEHLRLALDLPAIESAILSSNNIKHLEQMACALKGTE